ncbi:hypothetical protein KDL44_14930 [bacterium]|nr:hypothetical protein [bacterium]
MTSTVSERRSILQAALGVTAASLLALGSCASSLSGGGGNPDDNTGVNKAPVIVGNTIAANLLNPETDQTVTFSITASDPEGKALTYAWDDGNASAGEFDGTGASVFWSTSEAGSYTISVTVYDPELLSAAASTSMTVTQAADPPGPNDPPVFDQNGIRKDVTSPIAGQKIIFTATAADADGDALNFIWQDDTGQDNFSDPVIDNGTAKISWSYDEAGSYTITAIANDGKTGTTSVSAVTSVTASVTLAAFPASFDFSGAERCSNCHSEVYDEWKDTGHAHIEDNIQMIGRGRLESCRECHTVGYKEGGYIDYDLTPEFANVQCESCHGSGSGHPANGPLPVTFDPTDTCGRCHTEAHHPTFDEWQTSAHANFDLEEHNATGGSCVQCHNGEWFVRIQIRGEEAPAEDLEMGTHITCATCHDPHNSTFEHQLRVDPNADVIIPFGETVVNGGNANTCLKCHNGRRNENDMNNTIAKGGRGFHANSQGPMIFGVGGFEFDGYNYDKEHPHNSWNEQKCITCHMWAKEFEDDLNPAIVGHSFTPRIESCNVCHTFATADEMEAYKEEFIAGTLAMLTEFEELWPADWKTEENGVFDLNNKPSSSDPPSTDGPPLNDALGDQYRQCWWNYEYIREDNSKGVHNPAYSRGLLQSAIDKLKELNAQL